MSDEDKEIEYYKIIEVKNGIPKFMYHGVNNSKTIQLDTWMQCEKKLVTDGKDNTPYYSGFHAIDGYKHALSIFKKWFKKRENRYIVRCYLGGDIRNKHFTLMKGSNILADRILIKKEDLTTAMNRKEQINN